MPSFIAQNNCRFLHIPKTGGMWIYEFFKKHVGIKTEAPHDNGHILIDIDKPCFTFSFVRNPYTWYFSMYNFHCSTQWSWMNNKYYDFDSWFNLQIEDRPISRYVDELLGGYHSNVDYIGRLESLIPDMQLILKLSKTNIDYLYLNLSHVNVSTPNAIDYKPYQIQKINRIDDMVFRLFGYDKQS